jgi:hypothetical protein
MLSLDVLAVLIFFGMFFLIFGLISFIRCLVTSNRSKRSERILSVPIPSPVDEKGGNHPEKMPPEDHARVVNSSSKNRIAYSVQHASVASLLLFHASTMGPSATVKGGQTIPNKPTRNAVSVARVRFHIARHRMSGQWLHHSDAGNRYQTLY